MKIFRNTRFDRAAVIVASLLMASCATTYTQKQTDQKAERPAAPKKLLEADAPMLAGLDPKSLMPEIALPEKAEERFDVTANQVPAPAFFNSLV